MVYATKCQICGVDLTKAGFYRCELCKGYYCNKHRDPEAHNCPAFKPAGAEKLGLWEKIFGKKKEKKTPIETAAGLRGEQKRNNHSRTNVSRRTKAIRRARRARRNRSK